MLRLSATREDDQRIAAYIVRLALLKRSSRSLRSDEGLSHVSFWLIGRRYLISSSCQGSFHQKHERKAPYVAARPSLLQQDSIISQRSCKASHKRLCAFTNLLVETTQVTQGAGYRQEQQDRQWQSSVSAFPLIIAQDDVVCVRLCPCLSSLFRSLNVKLLEVYSQDRYVDVSSFPNLAGTSSNTSSSEIQVCCAPAVCRDTEPFLTHSPASQDICKQEETDHSRPCRRGKVLPASAIHGQALPACP